MAEHPLPPSPPVPPAGPNAQGPQPAPAPPPAVPTPAPAPARTPTEEPVKDAYREIAETVVFVVVLVLLLKLFVAEAFVIPTGSMATTLLGNHKRVACAECGFEFPINCSDEVDPPNGIRREVVGYVCPNCRFKHSWPSGEGPGWRSGDRVLVSKSEFHLVGPHRFDVPVFKYPGDSSRLQFADDKDNKGPKRLVPPDGPVNGSWVAMNYIKRLAGLGGETIAIAHGDLYLTTDLKYETYERPERPEDLWWLKYTYYNADEAVQAFRSGKMQIVRKPPEQILAMRRIVFHIDHQPEKSAGKKGVPPRWNPEPNAPGWKPDDSPLPKAFRHEGEALGWVRYQNLIPNWNDLDKRPEPEVIKNFLGYNAYLVPQGGGQPPDLQHPNDGDSWVGDLTLECEVKVESPDAEVVLELAKAVDRFQARFRVADGTCTLVRVNDAGEQTIASRPNAITKPGTYRVRLANVDQRLTVWVDRKVLPFGDEGDYSPGPKPAQFDPSDTREEGWVRANDLERPARIGARGAVQVSKIGLWRDTYYTHMRPVGSGYDAVETYYVQPDHYFCLGDNSSQSADSRTWGVVPKRLMLGRAVVIYFPLSRIGVIE